MFGESVLRTVHYDVIVTHISAPRFGNQYCTRFSSSSQNSKLGHMFHKNQNRPISSQSNFRLLNENHHPLHTQKKVVRASSFIHQISNNTHPNPIHNFGMSKMEASMERYDRAVNPAATVMVGNVKTLFSKVTFQSS